MMTFHVLPLIECIFLISLTRVCSHDARNKCLTAKLLKQGYRYDKLRKAFPSYIADTMNWFQNSMSD